MMTRAPAWVVGALLLGLLAPGCGSPRKLLTAQALPLVVTPAAPSWNVPVRVELGDDLRVRIENRGDEPVSVIWEESAYIDVDQRSHPVIPVFAATPGRQASTVIPPHALLEEVLKPAPSPSDSAADPLIAAEAGGRWWVPFDSAAPTRIGSPVESSHPALGKEIALFLVLERDGTKKTVLAKYALGG